MDSLWSDTLLGIFAVVGMVLLGAIAGAGAMLIVLLRHPAKIANNSVVLPFTWSRFKTRAYAVADRVRSHMKVASSKSRARAQGIVHRTKARLASLIPSRRLVLLSLFVVFGISLMVGSSFSFIKGEILAGFLVMTFGYAIIAAVWLLPRKSAVGPANDTLVIAPTLLPELFPRAISTLPSSQFDE